MRNLITYWRKLRASRRVPSWRPCLELLETRAVPSVFSDTMDFAAGNRPFGVAAADFTNNGKLDLAVTNLGGNDVSILLGNGDGTFSSPSEIAVGTNPEALAVGDFTGDGNLDLAVANTVDNDVSILLGDGKGGFSAAGNYPVGTYPNSVAVGDFNGDGNLDLAVANGNSNDVSILLGNGNGTFAPAVNYAVGSQPQTVVAADFTNNGNLDLAVTNQGDNDVSLLLGNGNGTFSAATNFAAGPSPQSMAVGDFTGNGKLDLAVGNFSGNDVSILLGNGAGGFAAPMNFAAGTNPVSVAVGDFTGSGTLDLAVTSQADNDVSILMGNGDGSFSSPTTFAAGFTPGCVAVGDFSGDGNLDLAVATNYNVAVLMGDGTGGFPAPASVGAGTTPSSMVVGDFTGNGILDIAVANPATNNVSVLLGDGNGGFSSPTNYAVGTDPIALVAADFTNNGKLDLAVVNGSSSNVSILLGNGKGGFASAINVYTGVNDAGYVSGNSIVAVGDFNDDGKLDLAIANYPGNDVAILLGLGGGGFGYPTYIAAGAGPDAVAVADFNNQRNADLAVADYNGKNVSILLGNGNGSFGVPRTFAVGVGPCSIAAADFNGDGNVDLAVANQFGPGVSILLGNGFGAFSAATNFAAGVGPDDVVTGDFRGDGSTDLAVANASSHDVSILLGDGSGGFGPPSDFAMAFNPIGGVDSVPVALAVGSFDKTGGADLAVANFPAGGVDILMNHAIASNLQLTTSGTIYVDHPFPLTVTALDALGNPATGYIGTVHFTSSDSAAQLPADATLTNGTGIFSVVLKTTGSQTLTGTDTVTSTITGTTTVGVTPIILFRVTAPASATAGTAFVFTVLALDQSNNPATGFQGIVHFSSTDPAAQLPADAMLINGIGSFAAILQTLGTQTITATNTDTNFDIGTSGGITVSSPAIIHYSITGLPSSAVAGTPFNLTVTAEDIQDNTVVGYAGTAHFSSTDTLAELPADTTLTNGVGVFSVTLNTQGSQSLTIVDATESSIRGTSSLIAVSPSQAPLAVTAFTPTATGFTAQFNKPFDPTLLNLYDDSDVYGPADLTLIGPGGEQVRGSLLLDSTDTSITFMKTGTGAAGLLAAGSYTATFRSASNGFADAGGNPLDINYTATFAVAPTLGPILSIPAFARGPHGAANICVPSNSANGVPITLANAVNVTDVTFELTYNPALLNISGTLNGEVGVLTLTANAGGVASFSFHSATASSGTLTLGYLVAQVPNSAVNYYKTQELLKLSDAVINGGSTTAVTDDGIQVVAYLGDVTGTGSFSPLDAALLERVAVNLGTGFTAYPLLDPAIVGGLTGSGNVNSTDVTLMNRLLVGLATPGIPLIPGGLTIPATGPDPEVSVPTELQETANQTIVVPVNISTARPPGSQRNDGSGFGPAIRSANLRRVGGGHSAGNGAQFRHRVAASSRGQSPDRGDRDRSV